jgi:hypothetical protein
MAIRLTRDIRNNLSGQVASQINLSGGVVAPARPVLQIFQGLRPTGVDEAPSDANRLLVQLQWESATTIFGSAGTTGNTPTSLDGQSIAAAIDPAIVLRSGTAQWFRILDKSTTGPNYPSSGSNPQSRTRNSGSSSERRQVILDGTVTIISGGGDIEFDDVDFVEDGTVVINSFKLTVPAEC